MINIQFRVRFILSITGECLWRLQKACEFIHLDWRGFVPYVFKYNIVEYFE